MVIKSDIKIGQTVTSLSDQLVGLSLIVSFQDLPSVLYGLLASVESVVDVCVDFMVPLKDM